MIIHKLRVVLVTVIVLVKEMVVVLEFLASAELLDHGHLIPAEVGAFLEKFLLLAFLGEID